MEKRVKIKGERGRWTATADGERLAVIHTNWRVGKDGYHDPMPGIDQNTKRYREFRETLETTDRVILQRDAGPNDLSRDGYIGIFAFKDLEFDKSGGVRLTLVERVANPKN